MFGEECEEQLDVTSRAVRVRPLIAASSRAAVRSSSSSSSCVTSEDPVPFADEPEEAAPLRFARQDPPQTELDSRRVDVTMRTLEICSEGAHGLAKSKHQREHLLQIGCDCLGSTCGEYSVLSVPLLALSLSCRIQGT
jgi:hypothetical protein